MKRVASAPKLAKVLVEDKVWESADDRAAAHRLKNAEPTANLALLVGSLAMRLRVSSR